MASLLNITTTLSPIEEEEKKGKDLVAYFTDLLLP